MKTNEKFVEIDEFKKLFDTMAEYELDKLDMLHTDEGKIDIHIVCGPKFVEKIFEIVVKEIAG